MNPHKTVIFLPFFVLSVHLKYIPLASLTMENHDNCLFIDQCSGVTSLRNLHTCTIEGIHSFPSKDISHVSVLVVNNGSVFTGGQRTSLFVGIKNNA